MAPLVKFQHDLPTVKFNVALNLPPPRRRSVPVVMIESARRTAARERSPPPRRIWACPAISTLRHTDTRACSSGFCLAWVARSEGR